MAQIIDALRRLERAGSDHSKATEKLLAAAKQLANKIIDSYAPAEGEKIHVGLAAWKDFPENQDGFEYSIQWLSVEDSQDELYAALCDSKRPGP